MREDVFKLEILRKGFIMKFSVVILNSIKSHVKMAFDIIGLFKKNVEPFALCWLLPSCLLIVAMENLNLEKACRVNLGLSDEICMNMINKSINDIKCASIESSVNVTDDPLMDLKLKVCDAETESQKLLSVVYAYRSPFASIIPFIIVLFAGGWSDKKGIRKPLVLLPIIGELLGSIVLLISSIFMDTIPIEVPAFSERVTPSLFGGSTLMLMGIYIYLTQMTTEENRTFRFGCLTVFLTLVPVLSIPFSGILFNVLGYTKLFTLCVIIYILGILHIIFVLEEVKVPSSAKALENEKQTNGVENPAFVSESNSGAEMMKKIENINSNVNDAATVEITKPGFLREFFDPTLALQLVEVMIKKRSGNLRAIIWLVLLCNIIFLASLGENDYTYFFTRLKLDWEGVQYSLHLTYSTFMALVGTLLMVGVFSKYLGVSDAMIGIVSTVCTLISKPIYAFAISTFMFYLGTSVDIFLSTKAIAIKAIISKVVAADELGRTFSILALLESVANVIFPPLYSFVYNQTVGSFLGAIYFLSEFFFLLTLIIFIVIYIMLKKVVVVEEKKDAEASAPDLFETTKL